MRAALTLVEVRGSGSRQHGRNAASIRAHPHRHAHLKATCYHNSLTSSLCLCYTTGTGGSSSMSCDHGIHVARQLYMPVFQEIPAEVTGHVPVKIWTDQVEASAEQQLTALAGCPFVFHHVAAMPDVHYGLGATIGSVFATENVLLPTAVGVDIGSFTGDTLIPLLDGTDRPIKELAELNSEFWVWSIT